MSSPMSSAFLLLKPFGLTFVSSVRVPVSERVWPFGT